MAPGSAHRPVLRLLGAFVAVSAAAGVLGAGLVVPAVAASGGLTRAGVDIFDELPGDLGDQTLSEATTILYSDGSFMARVYDQNRIVVGFDQIAPVMRQSIVAIEDSRFYEHGAIDARGIARAFASNVGGGDTQGASTLTQQYVKNILVEQAVESGDPDAAAAATKSSGIDGYSRKLREMKLAISVEKEKSKDEILAGYLNVAYFYNGVYGIEAAARYYFNKPAIDLTLPESAMLAGLVQNPVKFNPVKNPENALARRTVVLDRMLELNVIDQATHDAAVAAPLGLNIQPSQQGCIAAGSAAYFCDYVTRVVATDPTFGATAEDRTALLKRGGLTIRTTLDPVVQGITKTSVDKGVNPGQSARSAASVVQPGTGAILAMAQDTTYSPDDDVVGVTTQNYNVGQAMGGGIGFQQGSTFKPFTLATWLQSGRSLDSVVPSPAKGSDRVSSFTKCGAKIRSSEVYTYYNAESSSSPTMTVREATADSINTAYMSMEKQLDLCDIANTAQSLGVYKGAPSPLDTDNSQPKTLDLDRLASMTLGTNLVTPLGVAGAYAAFAAEGNFCSPVAIASVTDTDGKPMNVPSANCHQALDVNVARNVTEALQGGWNNGTAANVGGKGLLDGRDVASKTGTTNDSRNTWFAAYTPQLAAVTWVGHGDVVKPLNGERINGVRRRSVFGATIAGPIWTGIVGPASEALNLPRATFTDGTNQGLRTTTVDGRTKVPSVVGRSVSSATAALQAAGFQVVVSSKRVTSSSVAAGLVAAQSARSANAGATITLTRSSGAPAPAPSTSSQAPDPAPSTDGTQPGGGDGGGGITLPPEIATLLPTQGSDG